MAPNPYVEIAPPFIVDASGKPLSSGEDGPEWPTFIRSALIGSRFEISKYLNPVWKLSNYPGPFLWGGPFPRRQFDAVLKGLEQWAFGQPLTTIYGAEPGFFVAAHPVSIAPDTGVTHWPKPPKFRWAWVQENSAGAKYRVVYQGLAGGKLVRVA